MEKHDLLHEFPEYKEKIQELKSSNDHFKDLFEEYQKTENHIHRINVGEEVVIDEFAHELKARLLFLKDEIYTYLNNNQ